jgi:cysteine desulfurase family protein
MAVYLDNAATSFPKPEEVYRAVEHALREIGVAPGRGGYRQSLEASRLVFEAREATASLFGVRDSSRVVFTHSATEALNLAVGGLLRPGDHVVTTTMEHNALARPLALAASRGVEVTWVAADRCGRVSAEQISAALRPATRLVALAHCSNVTGTLQPVAQIGSLLRGSGTRLLVDAAQSAGAFPLDVEALGIDLLAVPGHKGLFGPQGTGVLYVGEGVDLAPLIVGGTGGFSHGLEQPESLPERFESGTHNTPGIAGLKAGVEFVLGTGVEAIRQREERLVGLLLDGLTSLPAVTIHGPVKGEERGAVVSFSVADRDPAEIGFRLDQEYGICVRTGLHCSPLAHQTIGTHPAGTVRVSPGPFTTDAEIEAFVRALDAITVR